MSKGVNPLTRRRSSGVAVGNHFGEITSVHAGGGGFTGDGRSFLSTQLRRESEDGGPCLMVAVIWTSPRPGVQFQASISSLNDHGRPSNPAPNNLESSCLASSKFSAGSGCTLTVVWNFCGGMSGEAKRVRKYSGSLIDKITGSSPRRTRRAEPGRSPSSSGNLDINSCAVSRNGTRR